MTPDEKRTAPLRQDVEAPGVDIFHNEARPSDEDRDAIIQRAVKAYASLRLFSFLALGCLFWFFILLAARLDWLGYVYFVPIYCDFIPLWIFPIFLCMMASSFQGTRVSKEGPAKGGEAIIPLALLGAANILIIEILICLKLAGVLDWYWTFVLCPVWVLHLGGQVALFSCAEQFKPGRRTLLIGLFAASWATALAALLVCLKLDGQFHPRLRWWIPLFPAWIIPALYIPVAMDPEKKMETVLRLLVLAALIMLPFNIDGSVILPWTVVLLPVIVVLLVNMAQIGSGRGPFLSQSAGQDSVPLNEQPGGTSARAYGSLVGSSPRPSLTDNRPRPSPVQTRFDQPDTARYRPSPRTQPTPKEAIQAQPVETADAGRQEKANNQKPFQKGPVVPPLQMPSWEQREHRSAPEYLSSPREDLARSSLS